MKMMPANMAAMYNHGLMRVIRLTGAAGAAAAYTSGKLAISCSWNCSKYPSGTLKEFSLPHRAISSLSSFIVGTAIVCTCLTQISVVGLILFVEIFTYLLHGEVI